MQWEYDVAKTKIIVAISLVIALSGCSNLNKSPTQILPVVETVETLIPVAQEQEKPPLRDLPTLPIKLITSESSDRDTAIAYDRTIQILQTEVLWYRKILYGDEKK